MKRSNAYPAILIAILVLLCLLTAAASLCIGAVSLPLSDVMRVLTGRMREGVAANIVLYTRVPRLLASMLAGAGLAASGVLIQIVLDNPLASPHLIGANAGAGFAVALVMALWPFQYLLAPAAAFLGALLAAGCILGISEKARASRRSLILAGVAVESIFSAATDALLRFFPNALSGYADFRVGGFASVTMEKLRPAFWGIPILLLLLVLGSGALDLMQLGPEMAKSLGLPVRSLRILYLAAAALLCALVVSYAGILGFVGLIVPHVMRRLQEGNTRMLLVTSALGGAFLVSACDLASRSLWAPFELPVGIVMSLAGGPFFLFLLFKGKKRKAGKHD